MNDPRSEKALLIAQAASTWRHLRTLPDGEIIYAIPSQTTRGLYYLVTETTCTCLDWQHNGLRDTRVGDIGLHCLCKHIRAVHWQRMQQEARER